MTRTPPVPGPIISPPALRPAAVVLLVVLALAYAAPLLRRNGRSGYLDLALCAVSAAALVTAAALAGRGRTRDWRAAAAVAAAAGAGYLISRGLGWPGAGGDVGHWRSAAGSVALATAVATLAVTLAALRPDPDPVRREPARRDPVRREPARRDPARRDPARRDPARPWARTAAGSGGSRPEGRSA